MTVAQIAYLFDVVGYRSVVAPLVEGVKMGDSRLLHETATRIASNEPSIWAAYLADERYAPEDLGTETEEFGWSQEGATQFWMAIVLAKFLQRAKILPHYYFTSIEAAIRQTGSSEEITQLLANGRDTITLFLPQAVATPLSRLELSDKPYWSQLGRGWLDTSDIVELLHYMGTLKSPLPLDERGGELANANRVAVELLVTAKTTGKGLFFVIAD